MSEITIFIPIDFCEGKFIKIPEEEFKHLKVKRAKENMDIKILNGKGFEAQAKLHLNEKKLYINSVKDVSYRELPVKVNLYQSILKSDKMDWVIQKATELGIYSVIPLITSRTVAKVKKEKIARWQKIAQEALKQCKRAILPEIKKAVHIRDLNCKGYSLVLWEKSERRLKETLDQLPQKENINIIVGPEGGFSQEEIELLISKGVKDARMGEVILRSETASVYILSVIKFLVEEYWHP